jgi:hypothetical protein
LEKALSQADWQAEPPDVRFHGNVQWSRFLPLGSRSRRVELG